MTRGAEVRGWAQQRISELEAENASLQEQYHESIAWRDAKIAELTTALEEAPEAPESGMSLNLNWDIAYKRWRLGQRQAALKGGE